MKAEARASSPRRIPAFRNVRWQDLTGPVRRIPQRLRERRFWGVQVLVLLITALHWELESTQALGEQEALSFVPVSFYFVPIVYAGLNFGMEGALPTALWSAALALPNVFVWHAGLQRFGELLQLAIMVSIAIVVARRVDEESRQRLRAEKTSASLTLLNEIGERLTQTLEVEQQLPSVLRRLLSGLSLESAWLCLESEAGDVSPTVLAEASEPQASPPDAHIQRLHARVAASTESIVEDRRTAVIPLVGESGMLGSLGATVARGETFADEQLELLTTVAHEIWVAVENARLYRERQESLESYVRQVTQAQEEERLRVARELHDETAQELVHLVRKLEQLGESAGPAVRTSVQQLLGMARDTLQSVRRFSHDLRPPVLDDLGLLAALEMVVDEANGQLPEGAQLKVRGEPRRLEAAVELALFRIAQEALRNVEKHAHATSATVELDFRDPDIRLAVTDDGRGFSPPKSASDLARGGKLGLLGMKERAELVGGSLELNSRPGRGTRLVVRVDSGDRLSS